MANKNKTQINNKPIPAVAKQDVSENKSVTLKKNFLWLSGILIIAFIAFSPTLKNGFTNWDDNVYIGENPLITGLSAHNIKNIFNTGNPVALNYHPVTILSLAFDYKLSQYNPKTYHITNLIVHLFNTALVFWFIFLLSKKKIKVATIVALFFAIHPMHVESVAWISERKDVLYVFFFMASLISYYKYLHTEGKTKFLFYVFTLSLFLLSILSKAMAVVLPLILLLMDYYQGRKFNKFLIAEKVPFFILSLLFGSLAYKIQSHGAAIADMETFTWLQRLEFASYGLINYIYHFFIPINLSCFYPYPNPQNIPVIFHIAPFILLSLVIAILWGCRKNKFCIWGVLFFCITIILVLQFITVGKVIMADRYSYLSYIGLLFPVAMSFDRIQNQGNEKYALLKKLCIIILILYTMIFTFQTYQRTKIWKNSDTLWTDAISKYPNSEAYHSRASYLANKDAIDKEIKVPQENEYDRALQDFTTAIQLNTADASVYIGRANLYSLKGQYELALIDYSKAIQLNKSDVETFVNRAGAYILMKQFDKAIMDFTTALTLNPNLNEVRKNRSYIYLKMGDYDKAVSDINQLIQREPSNADYYLYRSLAYFKMGNFNDALVDNTVSIKLNPNNNVVYFNRSCIYNALGKFKDALNDAQKAQSMGYDVPADYINTLLKK